MFGNRLGWGISGVIYLMAGAFLWYLHHRGTAMIEPTAVGLAAKTYTMKLDIEPRAIATWMTDEGSGIDAYKEAIAEYRKNPRAYDQYDAKLNTPSHEAVKPALNALIKARTLKGPGVFSDRKQGMITYDSDRPELKEVIFTLRDVSRKVGRLLQNSGEKQQARQLYEAMFTLGLKLWEERYVYDEMYEGRQWMLVSEWMAEMADSSAEKSQLAAFEAQFPPFFKKHVDPPRGALARAYPHTGDAMALARNGGDRMWRVEGAFALGRCKFVAETAADQSGAKAELERLTADPDPHVALAAKLARDLTVEEFRILR
jgi:hypothetical protein